jgi:threonylcarbamoyladenosine tRNA methylthiotransferase MtaB
VKVHLRMLGCRLNQAEIDSMARQFEQQGHRVVEVAEDADQIVVNTCAVTHDAVKSSRRLIADLHKANPSAQITVTGCHAQLAADQVAALPGVARVVLNNQKDRLVEQITGQPLEPFDREPHEREAKHFTGRTRAFIKVQDGCDNACTFCITTVARGPGRSRLADEIVREVRSLRALGYQEAVLTGVHLGSYGHDHGDKNGLFHLVQRLLAETDMPRLRLSSLEPWDLSAAFFDLWQDARLCPHLHLPLQSGCDATLRRMRRSTNTAAFRALIEQARAAIPDVRITTDLIVGFPGETDEEYAASRAFVQSMDFGGIHVFRYSVRQGTPAAKMRGQVPEAVKKARSHEMLAMAAAGEERFARRFLGSTADVLWENVTGAVPDGFINVGYTPQYVRVQAVHPRVLTNVIAPTRLIDLRGGMLIGVPVLESVQI